MGGGGQRLTPMTGLDNQLSCRASFTGNATPNSAKIMA